MEVQLVTSPADWQALRGAWDALLERSVHPSVFLSLDYQERGFYTFHAAQSEPFILKVSDPDGTIVGIVPLRRSIRHFAGIPRRVIEFLVTWEVDKPYLIAPPDLEGPVWKAASGFLDCRRRAWDLLEFSELPQHLGGGRYLGEYFSRPGYRVQTDPGPDCPLIDLKESWEQFRNRHRKYSEALARFARAFPDYTVVTCDTSAKIQEGIDRYIGLERASWKHGKIGLERNALHIEFYRGMLPLLAGTSRAAVHILSADGARDVAGIIVCSFGGTLFVQHTVYNPDFAVYSPGKLLMGLVLRHYREDPRLETADLLCGFAGYYKPWAQRVVSTQHVRVYRMSAFFRGYLSLRALRRRLWAR